MTASSRAKRVNLRNVISRPAKLGALELNKQETCSCTTMALDCIIRQDSYVNRG